MGMRVTTKEAAKITGISEYSLTCMRKRGVISYLKIGLSSRGRILFDIDVLNAELKKMEQDNKEQQAQLYEQYQKERYPEFNFKGSVLGRWYFGTWLF